MDKQLNRTDDTHTGWMVVQYGESMIVCRNNGFFTLVSKQEPLKAVYIEGSEEVSVAHEKSFWLHCCMIWYIINLWKN